jgi:hypothetical protein
MKAVLYTSFFIVISTLQVFAAPGDTTTVRAHDGRDLVWYERYKDFAVFPTNKEFNKVTMEFTMGCATGGCSDWDYTVLVYLLHPTGKLDSSISRIDTLSTSPLVVDTVWNVQPEKERFELGRLITPYGGYMRTSQAGFNNNWTHRFRFDVTDFQMMMSDSVEFEVFYQGWQSGFKATIDFEMIEGTPARRVRSIQNIYTPGGYNYITPQQFENDVLPATTISFDTADAMAALRFIPSGHGFINALNCAEFCQRNYYVKIDGVQRFEQLMWRDDCGLNPIYPQGGTWLYDRANWCPGSEVITYMHELTPWYQPGSTIDFDIDIEPIVYTVPSGETPANYNLSAQIITYERPLRERDAAVTRIISPSNHENFGRMNPSCGKAIVEITNYGSDTLREVEIHYGLHTGQFQVYHWTGALPFNQSTIVDLPFDDPSTWTSYMGVKQFQAWTVAPNGDWDMYSLNDAQVSMFNSTPRHPGDLRVFLVTNARGDETFWYLRNADGTVIDSGDGFSNNTSYNSQTWSLPDGCYELVVGDRGKNGMSFWANNDGAGLFRLISSNQGTVRNFNPDFGTEIRYYFTVGFTLSDELFSRNPKRRFEVFPNPASTVIYLSSSDDDSDISYKIRSNLGQSLMEGYLSQTKSIDIQQLSDAQYNLELYEDGVLIEVHKIVKLH